MTDYLPSPVDDVPNGYWYPEKIPRLSVHKRRDERSLFSVCSKPDPAYEVTSTSSVTQCVANSSVPALNSVKSCRVFQSLPDQPTNVKIKKVAGDIAA